jgi:predicted MFS family arabinose efflux permease
VMVAPVRVLQTLRPNIPAGVFAATAVSTVVFSATPFLIPAIADDRSLSVGLVGIISTAQLGGFVIATSVGPRFLRPRRRVMVLAIVIGVIANLLSAFSPWFGMLVATRMLSGVSLGLIAWIAWAEVFGDNERVGDVAIIGPIIGTIASPVVAVVVDRAGPDWLFAVLAGLYLVPALFVRSMRLDAAKRPHRERHRPTRAAAAILVVLTMLTLGGSATFVFAGAIGHDVIGLSAFTVSLVFAANALAGLPSARFRGVRKLPGLWLCLTGLSAVAVGTFHSAAVFWIALIVWGFAFWMGIPGAFALLAERSNYPDERAGDAQAVMALGRVVGPLLGGILYEISPRALGIGGGGVIIAAALLLIWVEWRIRPNVLASLRGA